jgi:hypothetical protein
MSAYYLKHRARLDPVKVAADRERRRLKRQGLYVPKKRRAADDAALDRQAAEWLKEANG